MKRNSVKLLITICFLQLIFTSERQVFDFLGHQWAGILFNFISILIIILAIFGVCSTFRQKFITIYLLWQLLTVIWNSYIVCFHLGLWSISRDNDFNLINLWTGSRSWWEANGPNCQASYNLTSLNDLNDYTLMKPSHVKGCLFSYQHVEIIQALVQLILSILAILLSIYLLYLYYESNEDDTFIDKPNLKNQRVENVSNILPPYSITLQAHSRSSLRSNHSRRSNRSRRKSITAHSKLISPSSRNLSSSIESFNNAHLNPLYNHYSGSRGSRYSLYTISQRHSPVYMNTETMI